MNKLNQEMDKTSEGSRACAPAHATAQTANPQQLYKNVDKYLERSRARAEAKDCPKSSQQTALQATNPLELHKKLDNVLERRRGRCHTEAKASPGQVTKDPASDHQQHETVQSLEPPKERAQQFAPNYVNHRPYCVICSFRDPDEKIPIYHRHFSSLRLRMLSGVEESGLPYLCPSCMSIHQPYPTDRIKLVACDSTMHEFFAPRGHVGQVVYPGDRIHQEYVTVSGAITDVVRDAVKYDFVDTVQRPMDAVLICGYNDLIRGFSRERIIRSLDNFANMIINCSIPGKRPNTCAIVTMMYPPQLVWYPDNSVPQPQGHNNQMEKIDWINNEIHYINMANGVPNYLGIHTYGVRTATQKWIDDLGQVNERIFKAHRWNWWREQEYNRMLHLTNEKRFKLGSAINNYFLENTF